MKTNWIKENRPANLEELSESNLGKYTKIKEGSDIKLGDYVHIFDDLYAEIGKGNRLCKEKVGKHSIIYRKK